MIYRKNIILKSKIRKAFYFTIIKHNHSIKLYRNYFSLHKGKDLRTDVYNSLDGINFEKGYKILNGSCASHNFHPFIHGDIYSGIGGMDSWKNSRTWHEIKSFDEFKIRFKNKYGKDYTGDRQRFKVAIDRLKNEKWLLDHSNGLYLFQSEDGINWKQKYKNPIITVDNPGYNSALMWKSTEFDGHINCLHDGEQFILYVRNNVKKGRRFIQYATSKNLMNWSKFRSLKLDYNLDTDNYYFPSFTKYKNIFVGMLPFFTDDFASIRLVKSKDGIKWEVVKDLFISDPIQIEGKNKNPCHPVSGIILMHNQVYFYIHHNYMGHEESEDVNVTRYKVSQKYFEDLIGYNE